jgi:hypothetical protein
MPFNFTVHLLGHRGFSHKFSMSLGPASALSSPALSGTKNGVEMNSTKKILENDSTLLYLFIPVLLYMWGHATNARWWKQSRRIRERGLLNTLERSRRIRERISQTPLGARGRKPVNIPTLASCPKWRFTMGVGTSVATPRWSILGRGRHLLRRWWWWAPPISWCRTTTRKEVRSIDILIGSSLLDVDLALSFSITMVRQCWLRGEMNLRERFETMIQLHFIYQFHSFHTCEGMRWTGADGNSHDGLAWGHQVGGGRACAGGCWLK